MKLINKLIQAWQDIESTKNRVETLENLLLDKDAKLNGFAKLK
jgi:hypothetical protein